MVYRYNNWFIFEPGDIVSVLPSGEKGLVLGTEKSTLNLNKRQQTVIVSFRRNRVQKYESNRLELVKRNPFSGMKEAKLTRAA